MKNKTDKELIEEFQGLDNAINNLDCFGPNDLMQHRAIGNELVENRGYEIAVERRLVIQKSS